MMPTTSWAAFSAPPFDCGLYGGEFRSSVCLSGRALATARWSAVIAGSPSDIRQMSVRPQSARSLTSCLTTQASPGPLASQSYANTAPDCLSLAISSVRCSSSRS